MDPSCSNCDSTISQVLHQITLYIHTMPIMSRLPPPRTPQSAPPLEQPHVVEGFHDFIGLGMAKLDVFSALLLPFLFLRRLAELSTHGNARSFNKTWRIFWQLSDGSSINCFQFLPCEYIMLHLESNNQGFFLKELCPQTHAIGTLKPFTCRMIQWFHTVKSWKLLFKRRGFRECQKVGRYYGMMGPALA